MNPVVGIEHSGHDYEHLQERWEMLASKVQLEVETVAVTPGGKPVLALSNRQASEKTLYLSAGVHGDECAPVWGLLRWAEENATTLKQVPLSIFPCLNPEGLMENTRSDQDGNDLNRCFSDRSIAVVAGWQDWVAGRRFSRCLQLHEDYDARGIYVYELCEVPRLGRKILESCSKHIAIDLRPEIDDNPFEQGLATHSKDEVEEFVADADFGGVEAFRLLLDHDDVTMTLTFESPSELDLQVRVLAHSCAVETFVADWSAENS